MKEVYAEMDPNKVQSEDLRDPYREIANLLGVKAAKTLHTAFRGQQVTFPVNFFTSDFMAEQIAAEYGQKTVKQLATKYGYSEKWIRKILRSQKDKKENS